MRCVRLTVGEMARGASAMFTTATVYCADGKMAGDRRIRRSLRSLGRRSHPGPTSPRVTRWRAVDRSGSKGRLPLRTALPEWSVTSPNGALTRRNHVPRPSTAGDGMPTPKWRRAGLPRGEPEVGNVGRELCRHGRSWSRQRRYRELPRWTSLRRAEHLPMGWQALLPSLQPAAHPRRATTSQGSPQGGTA